MHPQGRPAPIRAIGERALADERPAERERSALWFALGVALGILVGIACALALIDWRFKQMERRLIPPGKVYEHGEPVRR